MRELPSVPSQLIELALEDLEKVEKDDRYVVDMHVWHHSSPDDEWRCHVCLAGAVMAKSLDFAPYECGDDPEDIMSPNLSQKLEALDCFRRGNVDQGLKYMGIDTLVCDYKPVTPYGIEPTLFKTRMREIVGLLKEKDL
jgi:hypothetical protein